MTPVNAAWVVTNIPNLNARAFTSAFLLAFSNSSGLISSNIFIASEAPVYRTASITNIAAGSACCVGSALSVASILSFRTRWRVMKNNR